MRFKGTPKISFFPKPWSSEFETDGPVELFFNSEPEICHFKTHFQSKFRAPWFFAGQNSNKRHFAHRWCKTPGETAFQGLSSGGIFRLMESFQDLSLEDSQCWESMELSTESFKTMGAIILSCTFLGALALKWLFHDSYRWNRPKPWELSLKTYLSAFFPGALTLKWLFRESYRWNRPKPWELSFKAYLFALFSELLP